MPPGFAPIALTSVEASTASQSLIARGVGQGSAVDGTFAPVSAVAADLAVLARAEVALDVVITGRHVRRCAWFSVAGSRGVALVGLPDQGIELSAFPSIALGRELQRVVPEPAALAGEPSGITAALDGPSRPEPLTGTVLLSALTDQRLAGALGDAAAGNGSDRARTGSATTSLADEVARRTIGSLTCRVLGRADDDLLIGQVQWLASAQDWVALLPLTGVHGERLVSLHPVSRTSIGTWVAPLVAELLETAR